MVSRTSEDIETVANPKKERPRDVVPTYQITVVAGPDAGTSITLDGTSLARILVGHSRSCELHLDDPRVSRRHVALEATALGLRVTDLRSTNGTRSGRLRIVEAYLSGGETLVVGESTLQVDVVSQPQPLSLSDDMRFGRLLGGSAAMRRLYPLCHRLAASGVPLIIEGETGTGKELLAEAIHEEGLRPGAPFVVFDCTAVSPTLVESTLFGHERGAFTSAIAPRKGVFELASGGSLLIDEIGDLDINLQPKLLRALERSEVQRVGGEKWIQVDVRILAATRRDLEKEVQAGRFREDLYYRLGVARIELPPLRERHGDIGLLTRHLWRKLDTQDQSLPEDLIARFETYSWPGNIRELRNAIARRLALGDLDETPRPSAAGLAHSYTAGKDSVIALDDLESDVPLVVARQRVVDEFERRYVERVLAKYGGNVTRAARASGIARRYFYTLRTRHAV